MNRYETIEIEGNLKLYVFRDHDGIVNSTILVEEIDDLDVLLTMWVRD